MIPLLAVAYVIERCTYVVEHCTLCHRTLYLILSNVALQVAAFTTCCPCHDLTSLVLLRLKLYLPLSFVLNFHPPPQLSVRTSYCRALQQYPVLQQHQANPNPCPCRSAVPAAPFGTLTYPLVAPLTRARSCMCGTRSVFFFRGTQPTPPPREVPPEAVRARLPPLLRRVPPGGVRGRRR